MTIEGEIKNFPTTRYQGSKRKILPWIYDCLKDIEFNTVLDAFGGSGIVSYLFKQMGKSVTYNDFLTFNQIIGDSIISNNLIKLTENDVEFILNKSTESKSFISDNFDEIYYLHEENIWIDNIICNIKNLDDKYSNDELKFKKAIAYNALFQSCMIKRPYNLFHRKNLEMRTRDVSRNFGNKTTWETPFHIHFRKFVSEINRSVYNSQMPCFSTNQNIFDINNVEYDLVYLDSPYIKKNSKNESSDYLKCYHFLEGIARYDDWKNLIDNSSTNKRIKKELFPNYFTPKETNITFEKLIEKFQKSIIVISYKFGGRPSIEELKVMLSQYKKNVRIYDKHYIYALNNQNGNAILNREYLLIGY